LIPRAERHGNEYRDYPEAVVEILELIDGAQKLGFSLNEIRAIFVEAGSHVPPKQMRLDALRSKLAEIDRHYREIRIRRQRVIDLIAKFERQ
jgi:DNA-binding transcriptional MerR regulator